MQHLFQISRQAKIATAAVSLALAVPALAAMTKFEPARSTVAIVFKQMSVPVEARFKKFNAAIDYDSARPENSKASVEIEIASFDLGDAEYNKEVLKKEWFNAAQFPKASFVSSSIKAGANGKLDVNGTLSIKGKSIATSFPLTVKKDGNTASFDGSLTIKRLAFQIGEGEWKDTEMLADEVVIKFHVVSAM